MPLSPQYSQACLDQTAIIKVVLDMLASARFKDLTFQQISTVLGCPQQDPCYHFPSKLHLLRGLIDFFCRNHHQHLIDTIAIGAPENYSEHDKLFEIFLSFTESNASYRKVIAELAFDTLSSPDYSIPLMPDVVIRLRHMLVDQGISFNEVITGNLKFHFLGLIATRFLYQWCQQRVDNQNELMIELDKLLNFWTKYSAYLQ